MSDGRRGAHIASGKVREIYALDDDRLLLVASDRISTFDVILPTPIPDKGRVLTGMSAFWFARTRSLVPNHLLDLGDDGRSTSAGGSGCCRSSSSSAGTCPAPGWVDYRATGSVCGHALPAGLRESDRLPEPIVTPGDEGGGGARPQHHRGRGGRAVRRGARTPPRARRRSSCTRFASRARGGARDRPRRHQVRARRRRRRGRDARRRGADARLVALLAGRRVRARRAAAVVRQAVRARLLPRDRVGSHVPRARACPTTSSPGRGPATSRRSSG